jgi:hypothetical protein
MHAGHQIGPCVEGDWELGHHMIVPVVDLVDETFIVASPGRVALQVADRRRWVIWWPDLRLDVFMDRGDEGIRWSITGSLVGSAEIWLEAFGDGVILHYYLRGDLTEPESKTKPRHLPDSPRGKRRADATRRRHAVRWKQVVWELKAELEADHTPGSAGWA